MEVWSHNLLLTCLLLVGEFFSLAESRGYLKKICKASEIEVFSEHGVRIEDCKRSHIELALFDPSPRRRNRFTIMMEFKTKEPNGILFYGRSRGKVGELISLTLDNGNLIYKIQCPTLHAEVLIPTRDMRPLNDNRWHTVVYEIKSRPHEQTGYVKIDGYYNSKRYEVTCSRMTTLVIGGMSPKHVGHISALDGIQGHFQGCIKNLYLPIPLRSPPKYNAVSVCD